QSFSEVQIQFAVDSNAKDDLDAVNQRLAQLQLPEGASKPLAQTFSFSAIPSMTYALAAADGNLSRVTREAKTIIAPALAGATGAAEIKVIGGEQNAITITLDASRLAAHQLAPFQVSQALTGAQVDLPAGQSLDGNKVVPVEVVSAVKTAADLRVLPVGAGSPDRCPARHAGHLPVPAQRPGHASDRGLAPHQRAGGAARHESWRLRSQQPDPGRPDHCRRPHHRRRHRGPGEQLSPPADG